MSPESEPHLEEEEPQPPDYAAACDFLGLPFGIGLWLGALFLLPVPSSPTTRSLTGPLILIGSLVVSDIGWSLLARACERRRGEEGRTVSGILRHALLGFAAPLAVGAVALSLTDSVLLAAVLAGLIWIAAGAVVVLATRQLRSRA